MDCPKTMAMAIRFIVGRWFMVFATTLIMAAAGATYMFGLYSPVIKETLGYDQSTLNLLSFFKDLGGNFGVLSGLINEIMPPWVILLIGAVLNFFGYFMIWLSVTQKISMPKVWQMCVYICIAANSQSFANTGALVTAVKNFPESRGALLGLLKGYVGLSGAIFTQIYLAVYSNDPKALILLIGYLPAIISVLFLRTIRIMKVVRAVNELNVFYRILYVSLGLAGFLMILIILQKELNFNRAEYIAGAVIVILLLLLPIGVILREERSVTDAKVVEKLSLPQEVALAIKNPDPMDQKNAEKQRISCWNPKSIFPPPERGDDYTILQALFSIDMLILFITTIFGIGGTLAVIDNLGQIGSSLGYPNKSISTFVSLVSIWNYLGRVVAGFLSEYLLNKYKFPRPLMLTLILALSCAGHLLIAFDVPNGLYVASVIIGFCFGAQWPLLFAIISEIFGLKYYATLYNFGSAASPLGLYLLSVKVVGNLYDNEANRQLIASGRTRKNGEELVCIGAECFKLAFIIIASLTVFGTIVSFLLVIRTRTFYKGDIYKKFRDAAMEDEEILAVGSNGHSQASK